MAIFSSSRGRIRLSQGLDNLGSLQAVRARHRVRGYMQRGGDPAAQWKLPEKAIDPFWSCALLSAPTSATAEELRFTNPWEGSWKDVPAPADSCMRQDDRDQVNGVGHRSGKKTEHRD